MNDKDNTNIKSPIKHSLQVGFYTIITLAQITQLISIPFKEYSTSSFLLFYFILLTYVLPLVISLIFTVNYNTLIYHFKTDKDIDEFTTLENFSLYEVMGIDALLPCLISGSNLILTYNWMRYKLPIVFVYNLLQNDKNYYYNKCREFKGNIENTVDI